MEEALHNRGGYSMAGLSATPTKKSRKLTLTNESELDARWNRENMRTEKKSYVSKKKKSVNEQKLSRKNKTGINEMTTSF